MLIKIADIGRVRISEKETLLMVLSRDKNNKNYIQIFKELKTKSGNLITTELKIKVEHMQKLMLMFLGCEEDGM
jgi:hypothetical protein